MPDRDYLPYRNGEPIPSLDYRDLQRLLGAMLEWYEDEGWFQTSLGKECPDAPTDVGAAVLQKFGVAAWPLSDFVRSNDLTWTLGAIEFAFDNVSEPTDSYWHNWNACGTHVREADVGRGQRDLRRRVNDLLARFEPRYELREDGEVWEVAPDGLQYVVPESVGNAISDSKVTRAIRKFRHHSSTHDDRREAVRELADVLEELRDTVGTALPAQEEARLFEIANNFGIRHHNANQNNDYDPDVWLEWLFYSFLNAIALSSRVVERGG